MEPQRTIKLAKRRRVGKAAEKEERGRNLAGREGEAPIGGQEVGAELLPGPAHMYHQLCLPDPGGFRLPPWKPQPPLASKGTSFGLLCNRLRASDPEVLGYCTLAPLDLDVC